MKSRALLKRKRSDGDKDISDTEERNTRRRLSGLYRGPHSMNLYRAEEDEKVFEITMEINEEETITDMDEEVFDIAMEINEEETSEMDEEVFEVAMGINEEETIDVDMDEKCLRICTAMDSDTKDVDIIIEMIDNLSLNFFDYQNLQI